MDSIATSPLLQAVWSIVIGALGGVACALLGCFLILKRLSLLGDAIGHGVLPGIAVAVLLTGHLGGIGIVVGAMAFGVLTALLTQLLASSGRVSEDASLGVVFTSLFAAGVIMISVFLSHYDLDPGCVLLGDFTKALFVTFDWQLPEILNSNPNGVAGQGQAPVARIIEIPRAVPNLLLALVMTLAFVTLFWKELKISSFDPALASAMGYPAAVMHYLFVALVAACTVTTFESMGSILVLAMLVVPPATAHLLTDRLVTMLLWATGLAISASVFGYLLASRWVFACNVGGMIATVAGAQFVLVLFAAPRHGILARFWRHWRLALRIAGEEILGSLYRTEEKGLPPERITLQEHVLPGWLVQLAFARLHRRGWIAPIGDGLWQLTPDGHKQAESIVRAHRLWEAFLGQNFDLPLDHLHAPAARIEHFIGPALQSELASQLEEPNVDPHGKQIP